MPTVATAEHKAAAQKLREIYAIYSDAEDLINIGALSPGSNNRIDGAIALIDRLRNFLTQPVRQKTAFNDMMKQMMTITDTWDQLLNVEQNKV
jgi:flagellum-specific ATP synthase